MYIEITSIGWYKNTICVNLETRNQNKKYAITWNYLISQLKKYDRLIVIKLNGRILDV